MTHSSIAVLGEVMRRMANNLDCWQIFFGGTEGADEGGVGPRSAAAPTPLRREPGGARTAGSLLSRRAEAPTMGAGGRTAGTSDAARRGAGGTSAETTLTVSSRTAGTGDCRGAKIFRQVAPELRPPSFPAGSIPGIPRCVAELAGWYLRLQPAGITAVFARALSVGI